MIKQYIFIIFEIKSQLSYIAIFETMFHVEEPHHYLKVEGHICSLNVYMHAIVFWLYSIMHGRVLSYQMVCGMKEPSKRSRSHLYFECILASIHSKILLVLKLIWHKYSAYWDNLSNIRTMPLSITYCAKPKVKVINWGQGQMYIIHFYLFSVGKL